MRQEEKFYADLGAAIRVRRGQLGLTQGELADRLGLSRTSITNIERGRQRLLIDQFCRVCEVLDCSHESLLNQLTSTPAKKTKRSTPNFASMPAVAKFVAEQSETDA